MGQYRDDAQDHTTPGGASTPTYNSNQRQTVPIAEELEAPPPYTPEPSTISTASAPTGGSRRSSADSAASDVPLQQQTRRRGSHDESRGTVTAKGIGHAGAATGGISTAYRSPRPMTTTPGGDSASRHLEDSPGCCCSESGGCCCSKHGGCMCSDNGGCLFSNNGGCLFSDNGACCCSDHGGCCCADNGAACCSKRKH